MKNNVGIKTTHEQVTVTTPDGVDIQVDGELVELITELWSIGVETTHSCQGKPGAEVPILGRLAYISIKRNSSATMLIHLLLTNYPQLSYESVINGRSEVDYRDSIWEFYYRVHDTDGPIVIIRFPSDQIPYLVSFLRD